MTQVPVVENSLTGLCKVAGNYHAIYFVDGQLQTVDLKTHMRPYAEKARDRLYEQLKEEGATSVFVHEN